MTGRRKDGYDVSGLCLCKIPSVIIYFFRITMIPISFDLLHIVNPAPAALKSVKIEGVIWILA
jgi:hypothetical protein